MPLCLRAGIAVPGRAHHGRCEPDAFGIRENGGLSSRCIGSRQHSWLHFHRSSWPSPVLDRQIQRGISLWIGNNIDPGSTELPAAGQNPFCTRDCAKFCTGECSKLWIALSAPTSAPAVGDWKVANGVHGPQWDLQRPHGFHFC